MSSPDQPDAPAGPSLPSRRTFLGAAAAAVATAATSRAAQKPAPAPKPYRVGVIGHTGRGNYGHGLDTVWREVPGTQVVAVADGDPKGLDAAVKRLKAPKGYADYRKMLDAEKPDLVSVCPRHLDQHRDMVLAAAAAGVRGIYLEKPMCRTLAEADDMLAACEEGNVKLVMAHQTRYSPRLEVVRQLIKSGRIGRVIEFRGRGKEDRRGGGEDLWVLGTHVLNLVHTLGGDPRWCFATVQQDGRPVRKADVRPGPEGIGPLAGDEVHAMYRLAGGATAYFDSVRGAGGRPSRFGLWIHGSKGIIELHTGYLPDAHLLEHSSWSPGRTKARWLPITSAGVDKPEPLKGHHLHAGNVLAVKDLIAAIERDRQSRATSRRFGTSGRMAHEARAATEMIVAVFESHRLGRPVAFPLKNRQNPLAMLS